MRAITLFQAKKILRDERKNLSREYGVTKIGIFGSFAFGDNKKGSDIDILVDFKRPISLFDFIGLENYLAQRLGRKVDLVAASGLKKYIRKNILDSVVYV